MKQNTDTHTHTQNRMAKFNWKRKILFLLTVLGSQSTVTDRSQGRNSRSDLQARTKAKAMEEHSLVAGYI